MKIAAEVARDIMNEDQILLPGYEIVAHFFDDECDPDRSNRAMLEQYANNDNWVGVGGMGCSSVCKSLSVISDSLFLPMISFECSDGEDLSDRILYPAFMRLGTRRNKVAELLYDLRTAFNWGEITILVMSTGEYSDIGEELLDAVQAAEVAARVEMPTTDAFADFVAVFQTLKSRKARVIFFVGGERDYRRALCASEKAGTFRGLTWISQGIKSRSWWTEEDEELTGEVAECTADTIKQLYQGALSITGYGSPLEADRDQPLYCFHGDHGYTSRTLNAEILKHLELGYPEDHPNRSNFRVERPHDELVNLVADGMCMFAVMMQHMLGRGYGIDQLRTPRESVYDTIVDYMKNRMEFTTASGGVLPISARLCGDDRRCGNDFANNLAVWQADGNSSVLVGLVDLLGNRNLSYATGLRNDSWTDAPDDIVIIDDEGFPVLAVVIPTLAVFFCGIVCYAIVSGRAGAKGGRSGSSNQA